MCIILFTGNKFSIEEVKEAETVSIFVDSRISNEDLLQLHRKGIKKILLRSAGYGSLDIDFVKNLDIEIYKVASYSPESVAEHVSALLSLTRSKMIDRRKHNLYDPHYHHTRPFRQVNSLKELFATSNDISIILD